MTARRTTPHHVSLETIVRAVGTRRERTTYRWVCTRDCVGRESGNRALVESRGRRHEERRKGKTTRG